MKTSSFSLRPFDLVRWTARILAALAVGLVLVFFVGTGGFNPLRLTSLEAIQMVLFVSACAGMLAAWRWEFAGGAVATSAIGLFLLLEFTATGRPPKGPIFYVMFVPGILFMLSGRIRDRTLSRGESK